MTTILLYCIADTATDVRPSFPGQISEGKMIAELITRSQSTVGSTNCYALIQTPNQTHIDDNGTPLPVEPFDTSYKDASIETLIEDVKRRIPEPRGLLTPNTFAFLDERSAHDQTVVLVHEFESMSQDGLEEDLDEDLEKEEEEEEAEDDDDEKVHTEWKQFRVKFVGSWEMMAQLEESEHAFMEAPPTEEHCDETGVYQVKGVVLIPGQ